MKFLLVLLGSVLLLMTTAGAKEEDPTYDSLYNTIFFNSIDGAGSNGSLSINGTAARLPLKVYQKVQSYMKDSLAFKHFTFEEIVVWTDNIDRWEEPEELSKAFPYYLAGYDYEDRPVWIGEVGKFNVKKVIEKGKGAETDLVRYLFKACTRIMMSMMEKDTPTREIRSVFLLGDWEGLDYSQVLHRPTVVFILHMVRTYLDFLFLSVGEAWSINANFAAAGAFQYVRPILGRLVERFEVFGTNKEKWAAALRRTLPPEVIPPWYGGSKSFKPLKVFG